MRTSRTKSVDIKATNQNLEAMHKIDFYSNSPHWHFLLVEWSQGEITSNDILSITSMFDYFDNEKRENQVDAFILELEKLNISYTRIIEVRETRSEK